MRLSKKSIVLGLLIVAIILLIFVAYSYFTNTHELVNPPLPSNGTNNEEGFKTYRNEEYGFEFEYPSDWVVQENAFGSAVSMFNMIVKPVNKKHFPDPIRINILPNDWIERVRKSFEADEIESFNVEIGDISGIGYLHTDMGLPQIDYLIPRGDYWVIIGGKKEYETQLNQVFDTFKFIK